MRNCSLPSRVSNWGTDNISSLQRDCLNIDLCYFFSFCSSGVCSCIITELFCSSTSNFTPGTFVVTVFNVKGLNVTEPTKPKWTLWKCKKRKKRGFLYFPSLASSRSWCNVVKSWSFSLRAGICNSDQRDLRHKHCIHHKHPSASCRGEAKPAIDELRYAKITEEEMTLHWRGEV